MNGSLIDFLAMRVAHGEEFGFNPSFAGFC
jgi:hypothetical protein